jgi:chemotaxis protein MotA
MLKMAEEEHAYVYVVRVILISSIKGVAPIQALEFGRRAIPANVRPSFTSMEKSLKGGGAEAQAAA